MLFQVWDVDKDGAWICSSEWKAHSGSMVRKVTWAHPDFGQLLGTCSFDGRAAIWEEEQPPLLNKSNDTSLTWSKITDTALNPLSSVYDITFSPPPPNSDLTLPQRLQMVL